MKKVLLRATCCEKERQNLQKSIEKVTEASAQQAARPFLLKSRKRKGTAARLLLLLSFVRFLFMRAHECIHFSKTDTCDFAAAAAGAVMLI